MLLALTCFGLLCTLQTPSSPQPAPKIQIKDSTVGTGHLAKTGDVVTIDYTGTLLNGTVFDSSAGIEPLTFMLGIGQVIKGMDGGVEGMKEGGRRVISIPPTLGYGDRQVGSIPPNSTLVFTVDLVRIEPKVETTVQVKGAGPGAKLNDVIYAYVVIKVKDGKVIADTKDSSKDPVPLQVGQRGLPIGMMAGLIGCQAGEKFKIVAPPSLGFPKGIPVKDEGERKAGSIIPPNSIIEFDVEVTKVESPDQAGGKGG